MCETHAQGLWLSLSYDYYSFYYRENGQGHMYFLSWNLSIGEFHLIGAPQSVNINQLFVLWNGIWVAI